MYSQLTDISLLAYARHSGVEVTCAPVLARALLAALVLGTARKRAELPGPAGQTRARTVEPFARSAVLALALFGAVIAVPVLWTLVLAVIAGPTVRTVASPVNGVAPRFVLAPTPL